jgi:hypothetical protein
MVHYYRGLILGLLLGLLLVPVGTALAAGPVVTITVSATVVPTVVAYDATGVGGLQATLRAEITSTGGLTVTTRGFEWGYATGNYTESWNETGTYGTGAFNHTITGLDPEVQVFWRAFAVNGIGTGFSEEKSYFSSQRPGPPTDFTITRVGVNAIDITWTMGAAANTTIIRASETEYPTNVTEGYAVYSGNETEVVLNGLAIDMTTYYYSAWSENGWGYSFDYAEASIGDPIGVPSLVFAIGLCGFALWKKDWIRVLLAVCVIMWGIFAMTYDVKIAAPLVGVGTVLFFMGIVHEIQARREQEG